MRSPPAISILTHKEIPFPFFTRNNRALHQKMQRPFCFRETGGIVKKKLIICPKCIVRVMQYDGITTSNQIARCPKCNRKVIYNPEKDEITMKDAPQRVTGSGVRFW